MVVSHFAKLIFHNILFIFQYNIISGVNGYQILCGGVYSINRIWLYICGYAKYKKCLREFINIYLGADKSTNTQTHMYISIFQIWWHNIKRRIFENYKTIKLGGEKNTTTYLSFKIFRYELRLSFKKKKILIDIPYLYLLKKKIILQIFHLILHLQTINKNFCIYMKCNWKWKIAI